MSSFEAALSQLPPPILNKLDAMIRRVRRLLFVRGLFATLAVALTCLLVIMAIDATITLFSSTVRWALSLTGLAITLVAAWWFLVRPLSRKLTLTHMARILEIRHPELQERISTAVELLSSDDPDSIKGSEELIEAVVDSAVVDVEAVDPKTEFAPVKTKRFAKIAAVAAGIVLLLLAIWPNQAWTLLTRAIAPFLDIGNAYAESMVVEPGDVRIARGENLTISMGIDHKKLKRAEIRKLLPDGSETVERMTLVSDDDGKKQFSLTFPNVQESFAYRVRAGSAVSEFFDVEAIDPPDIESLTIRYDFPEYTGAPDVETVTETGEIRAVAHTRVTVTVGANKPLWTAKMMLNDAQEIETPSLDENLATWEFELHSGMNGTWSLELGDKEGFSNAPTSYPLEVLPDKPPTVQIAEPILREMNLKPTERLPIVSEIVEDFGVAEVALLVTPDGAPSPIVVPKDMPEAGVRSGEYLSDVSLDIAALGLKPEQRRIAVQVQAKDGRPADYDGPGIGLSEVLFINLDRNAKSLADQAIEAQRRELNEKMQKAEQELKRAKSEIERAERELKKGDEINDSAESALDQFSERSESARDALDELASTLDTPLFREQSQKAQEIADVPVAKAMEKADLIPVTDDKNQRVAEARDAKKNIDEAIKDLDSLEKSLKEADSVYDMISELNDLANRQQEVAQKAREWSEKAEQQAAEMAQRNNEEAQKQFDQQQRREQQQFQAEQNRVENQLGEMLKDNAAALAEVLEQQREEARQMAQQAQALAEEQEALRDINREASRTGSEEALKEQLLDHLQKKQEELAAKAAQKAEAAQQSQESKEQPAESETPAASPEGESLAKAADQAKKAAQELAARDLEPASEAANEASESLAQAAESGAEEPGEPDAPGSETPATESDPGSETPATESESAETAESPEMAEAGEESEVTPQDPSGSETPDLPSNFALAETQMALARQIEAVKNGNLQEALAAMEAQLAEEADALQADATAMETTMRNLDQNAAQNATTQAERALDQGSQKAEDSGRQLAQAQQQQDTATERGDVAAGELAPPAQSTMQRAQAAQQQSQSLLEQAADALARSSEEIGQTLEGLEPSDMDDRITNSEDLAEGFEDVSQSSQSQNAQQAAQQSQQAAESLQQLAQAAMQKMGNNPNQNPQQPLPPQDNPDAPDSENLNETGEKTSDADGSGVPPELSSLGISVEDWTRFKGALVGGNATAIETELPPEYRELVGRYFQVIAKEAGKNE